MIASDSMQEYLIDGSDKVLGRLSSKVAKLLLTGNKVNLVNAEKIVVSGHAPSILSKYKQRLELKDKANPEHSPYWSRRADLFVKRVIRGMLPYKKARGKSAYKQLRVYIGIPKEFKDAKPYALQAKGPSEVFEKTHYMKDILGKL